MSGRHVTASPGLLRFCRRCKERLPPAAFGSDRGTVDGLANWCRECGRRYARERYRRLSDAGVRRAPSLGMRYAQYRADARRRGLVFALTREQFAGYAGQPCHYCGGVGFAVGLDRVDNLRGYEPDNLVPCCGTCNSWKLNLEEAAFKEHVRRLYEHFVLGHPVPAVPVVPWQQRWCTGRPRLP